MADEKMGAILLRQARTNTAQHKNTITNKSVSPSMSVRVSPSSPELVATAALSLLNLACYFLSRQLATLEKRSLEEGGFTERLYRLRTQKRNRSYMLSKFLGPQSSILPHPETSNVSDPSDPSSLQPIIPTQSSFPFSNLNSAICI
jgi:four helix bundle suffix protein